MLPAAVRWVSRVASWIVVVLVAAATTAGLADRLLKPDDAPYLLLTREAAAHPVLLVVLFALCLAGYAWLFSRLGRMLEAWRDDVRSRPAAGRRTRRLERLVQWAFGRWYRAAAVLAIAWLPFYLTSFPGQPSPDAANMLSEFLLDRSYFDGAPMYAPDDLTSPIENYPTSSYLLTDGDSLWSNHHPLYLMLGYGSICWASIQLFGSLVPGLVVISAGSAAFTLVAFGRALSILGSFVTSWKHRAVALGLTAATPLIALWSMAPHKNQLFCAAFVWWLALIAQLLHGDRTAPLGRRWYAETVLVSLVMAISVQFGWIVLAFQAVAMLAVRGRRLASLAAMGIPAVLVWGTVTIASAQGLVMASDPIETQGVQLQELALILREHPEAIDTLDPDDRAALERAFDVDALALSFDPSSADDAKSTGPLDEKTLSYRYRTVTPEDLEVLNPVVAELALRYPGTAVDGLFLKSYRYLDPLDEGTDWYPPWNPYYEREIGGYQAAPMDLNLWPRGGVRAAAFGCYDVIPCRVTESHGTKTVALVLLMAAAIAVRRRYAWLWALPFALQLGIAGVSPLSAGGRYVLAFSYAIGIAVLLFAISDRTGTPSGSRGSSTPSPRPSR